MEKLRQLVLAYERDEKHVITQAHIAERQRCVITYGGEAVREFLKTVYAELLQERRIPPCSSVENVKKPLSEAREEKRKSTSGLARNAKTKKISTTHRRGFRVSTHRR
jgi:hypothetical protein